MIHLSAVSGLYLCQWSQDSRKEEEDQEGHDNDDGEQYPSSPRVPARVRALYIAISVIIAIVAAREMSALAFKASSKLL